MDESSRRSRLLTIKLRALVAAHLDADVNVNVDDAPAYSPGAGLVVDGEAWTLIDDRPAQRLGSALAWAVRRGASALNVVAESDTGLLARRATQFRLPVRVWQANERVLVAARPDPIEPPPAADPSHLVLRELIAAGGATPVVEHGVVSGEVRGLEVCRVVDDPQRLDGPVGLEVGVGVHDREAFKMLHADTPVVDSLSRVVDAVRAHRAAGAPRHPFNRMSPERFLRWQLIDDPSSVGLASVTPVDPPVARSSVVDAVPCVGLGVDDEGAQMLVVCSSGVDLDLIPYAADARLAARGGATPGVERVLVVTPARDRLAVTVELAELLAQSVELVSID